ncbi:hypothetical protein EDD18DRAFT_1434060 [Armillaria luteobubalina]|uniref:F-box domain-containing protein n=1 Tax=Armillaria luteobubalina TaxID=153913 RepID=A0AA39UAD8_9AGAR|nr:hypothetical protein EDD18DRAFT_1434060 [Armillaria luteobubalina]
MSQPCSFCHIVATPEPHDLRSTRVAELLSQNGPPLEAEMPSLLAAVRDAPASLSAIDEKIQETRKVLETLLRERERMSLYVSDATTLLQPIRALSNEIFYEIFSWCVSDWLDITTEPQGPEDSLDPRRPPWTFTCVSRRWRDVALSLPRLWSTVVFDTYRYKEFRVSHRTCLYRLGLQLERSRNSDLSVSLHSGFSRPISEHPAFVLLELSTCRWKRLYMNLPPSTVAAFSGNVFSRLRELVVRIKDTTPSSERPIVVDTFRSAFHLRSFQSRGNAYPCAVFRLPWSNLTAYTCDDSSDKHSWTAMKKLKSAKHLSLYCASSKAAPSSPLTFPTVQDLVVEETRSSHSGTIAHTFRLLVLPSLSYLTLNFPDDRIVHFPKIATSSAHLKTLDLACNFIHDPRNIRHFLDFLRVVDRVENLYLRTTTLPDVLLVGLTKKFDQVLLLPTLRNLTFSPKFPSVNTKLFFDMLESRCKGTSETIKEEGTGPISSTSESDKENPPRRMFLENVRFASCSTVPFEAAEDVKRWKDICDGLKMVYGST